MYGTLFLSRPNQSVAGPSFANLPDATVAGLRPTFNGSLGVNVPPGGSVGRPVNGHHQVGSSPIPTTTSGVPVVGGNGGGRALMIPRNPYTYGPDRFGNIVAQQPDYVQIQNTPYRFGQ